MVLLSMAGNGMHRNALALQGVDRIQAPLVGVPGQLITIHDSVDYGSFATAWRHMSDNPQQPQPEGGCTATL